MSKSTTIQVRVDAATKKRVVSILDTLGIGISEAMTMYLRQIVFAKGIPFEVKIPNKLTAETLEKMDKGEDLHEVGSVEELFEEMNAEDRTIESV